MQELFFIDGKDYGKLDKLLAADPYAEDSFGKLGYVLKESRALGLEAGFYALFFESPDDALVKKLSEKLLAALPLARRPEEAKKTALVAQIKQEQDNAAAGFGSIFG